MPKVNGEVDSQIGGRRRKGNRPLRSPERQRGKQGLGRADVNIVMFRCSRASEKMRQRN